MKRIILSGGSIVLADRVYDDGSVVIEGGRIAEVSRKPRDRFVRGDELFIDVYGRIVMPGVVDLHNDALEVEINPRPRAELPLPLALAAMDRRLAAAGVTTEFNAVFFTDMARNERKLMDAADRVRTVFAHGAARRALVDHHILFRVDLWKPESLDLALEASRGARVPLLSLNDHTPGQGQYRDIAQFKRYYAEHLGRSAAEVEREVESQMARAAGAPEIAAAVLARVHEATLERGLTVMSHDDDSPARVELMYAVGARIGEFPVTLAAAQRQRALGMTISAGAPNIVRGGSASGNIGAAELLAHGLLDALCADYHAPSLIVAALQIAGEGQLSLAEAVRLVTLNPAKAVGLDERIGSLEAGKQADVIVVDPSGPVPTVELTLRAGEIQHHIPARLERGAIAASS